MSSNKQLWCKAVFIDGSQCFLCFTPTYFPRSDESFIDSNLQTFADFLLQKSRGALEVFEKLDPVFTL